MASGATVVERTHGERARLERPAAALRCVLRWLILSRGREPPSLRAPPSRHYIRNAVISFATVNTYLVNGAM
jgi:hypothetical protein